MDVGAYHPSIRDSTLVFLRHLFLSMTLVTQSVLYLWWQQKLAVLTRSCVALAGISVETTLKTNKNLQPKRRLSQ